MYSMVDNSCLNFKQCAQAALGPGVSVFLSDVETDPWTESSLQGVIDGSDRLIVTRGDKGALEYRQNDTRSIPAEKV